MIAHSGSPTHLMSSRPVLVVAQPPAVYLVRPPLVVDCSLIAAWLFQEPERDEAQARIAGRSLHAPALLDFEIVNVAVKKLKKSSHTAPVTEGIARLAWFEIERHDIDPAGVFALAHRYDLSGYDAAYLWLAAELRAPLATFDRQLGTAAQAHLSGLP